MEDLYGLVFDIEEFAVFDGPGIRTTVFMKGCPLRCNWCHNPEGLSSQPQRAVSSLCIHCGQCKAVCPHPEGCTACGACIPGCPRNCIRILGKKYSPQALAAQLERNADVLRMSGGGITFSGGECALQTPFVLAVRQLLPQLHFAVETCGHVKEDTFQALVHGVDLVMMDIKHTDSALHKRYTGVDNTLIRRNLEALKASGRPFFARVPLIPGVNDTWENLCETARWLQGAKALQGVELLPYNRSAGAKYASVGMAYTPDFDTAQEVQTPTDAFRDLDVPVTVY